MSGVSGAVTDEQLSTNRSLNQTKICNLSNSYCMTHAQLDINVHCLHLKHKLNPQFPADSLHM